MIAVLVDIVVTQVSLVIQGIAGFLDILVIQVYLVTRVIREYQVILDSVAKAAIQVLADLAAFRAFLAIADSLE